MKSVTPISNNQMIFTIEELKEMGLSHYRINQLVLQGVLMKLNKKCYENLSFTGEVSVFYYVQAYIPKGVICLLSAAVYYGLSTDRPDVIDVAISRKAKVSTLPEWPTLKIHYFTDERFETGVQRVMDGCNGFQIYDMEKTVADIVFYRESIGIEETKEILTAYLRRKDRNLNQLVRYAEKLKCGEIMKQYLEVLV